MLFIRLTLVAKMLAEFRSRSLNMDTDDDAATIAEDAGEEGRRR